MFDDIEKKQKNRSAEFLPTFWFFTLLRTICVCFLRDVEDVVPYRKILLFSVGEAFRLPFFVHGMRLFSGGGNQTSLRSVANLLRKNCPSPTACFLHTKNE